jgi:hypothetical protein
MNRRSFVMIVAATELSTLDQRRFLSALNGSIKQLHPQGHELLYFSGKWLGSRMAKGVHCTPSEAIVLIQKTTAKAGLGNITEVRNRGKGILVTCRCGLRDRCHNHDLMAGFMAGIMSAVIGNNCTGYTLANGRKACRFKLCIGKK